jgi:hypothetical protein
MLHRAGWPVGRPRSANAEAAPSAAGRGATQIETDDRIFNGWMERGRADLHLLLTETPEGGSFLTPGSRGTWRPLGATA